MGDYIQAELWKFCKQRQTRTIIAYDILVPNIIKNGTIAPGRSVIYGSNTENHQEIFPLYDSKIIIRIIMGKIKTKTIRARELINIRI